MKRIRVSVIHREGRAHWEAQWSDPLSGRCRRKTTGESKKREAERFAAKLEKELNEGREADYRTTWSDFRVRYETEVLASLSSSTANKALTTFNTVERIVSPKFVRSLDAGEISKMSAKLREEGLAPASIASRLRTLKAALRWAARLRLIPEAPHITMPAKATEKAGGRAPTPEEFERMLEAVPRVVRNADDVDSWRFLLRGLWWSGLRITEACRLHWIDDRYLTVDLSGKRAMFVIKAAANKNRKDQRFPAAPEFVEMLLTVPGNRQTGFIFNPRLRGRRAERDVVIRTISSIGRKAGVIVDRSAAGEPVYASAHDLRRSFGTRWSKRVMPPVLKLLMRHAAIQTTLTFYVDQNAEEAAEALWNAMSVLPTGTKTSTNGGDTTPVTQRKSLVAAGIEPA